MTTKTANPRILGAVIMQKAAELTAFGMIHGIDDPKFLVARRELAVLVSTLALRCEAAEKRVAELPV